MQKVANNAGGDENFGGFGELGAQLFADDRCLGTGPQTDHAQVFAVEPKGASEVIPSQTVIEAALKEGHRQPVHENPIFALNRNLEFDAVVPPGVGVLSDHRDEALFTQENLLQIGQGFVNCVQGTLVDP